MCNILRNLDVTLNLRWNCFQIASRLLQKHRFLMTNHNLALVDTFCLTQVSRKIFVITINLRRATAAGNIPFLATWLDRHHLHLSRDGIDSLTIRSAVPLSRWNFPDKKIVCIYAKKKKKTELVSHNSMRTRLSSPLKTLLLSRVLPPWILGLDSSFEEEGHGNK